VYSIVGGAGAFSILPGQSWEVTVRFSPTALGVESGSVSVTHDATNMSSPTPVALSGAGGETIQMSLDKTGVDFGSVPINQTGDQAFLITNSATSAGSLSGNITVTGSKFSIVNGGGFFSLTPGQSWVVTVRFSPTALGPDSGSVSISHNATNMATPTSVALIGTGGQPILMSLDKTSIGFGDVPSNETRDETILITNSAISTGSLTGAVTVGGSGFSIVTGAGIFSLTPGQSWLVTVRFAPVIVGAKSGSVSISHTAGNMTSPTPVPLSGTGIPIPEVAPEPRGPQAGAGNSTWPGAP